MKRIGEIRPKRKQLTYRQYMNAAERARRKRGVNRKALDAPPIGSTVAIKVFIGNECQDMLFADHIDVCKSHTTVHYSRNCIEVYPVRRLRAEVRQNTTTVYYENNTSFEIIRLN